MMRQINYFKPTAVTDILEIKTYKGQANAEFAKMRGVFLHKALQEMASNGYRIIPDYVDQMSELYVSLYRASQLLQGLQAKPIAVEKDVTLIIDGMPKIHGRADLIANINGKLTLIDYKTENRPVYKPEEEKQHEEWAKQLSLYAAALEQEGIHIDDLLVIHIPRKDSMTAIRLPILSVTEILCGTINREINRQETEKEIRKEFAL